MATYAIGDLQGCLASFEELLAKLNLDFTRDSLWLTGDLVNRGPQSLGTLRRVKQLVEDYPRRIVTVLGNHDLYLLAVHLGVVQSKSVDTFTDILEAPDCDALLHWLRTQPLLHRATINDREHILVHAGLLPQWSATQAETLANEVQAAQAGLDYKRWFNEMFGARPNQWSDDLRGYDRLRVIVNGLTRLRVCTEQGAMEFSAKGDPKNAPVGYLPWFDVPNRTSENATVVFGHWSAYGLALRDNLISLDSGCVWGRALTAVRLEDRQVISVACPRYSNLTD